MRPLVLCPAFSKAPAWVRALAPHGALMMEEMSWNAYPHSKTGLQLHQELLSCMPCLESAFCSCFPRPHRSAMWHQFHGAVFGSMLMDVLAVMLSQPSGLLLFLPLLVFLFLQLLAWPVLKVTILLSVAICEAQPIWAASSLSHDGLALASEALPFAGRFSMSMPHQCPSVPPLFVSLGSVHTSPSSSSPSSPSMSRTEENPKT